MSKLLAGVGIGLGLLIVGAIAVLESADDARWLKDNRPNVLIPDELIERLDDAGDPREEGIKICVESLQAMADIPGIVGANIMASRDLATVPEAIGRAGLSGQE